MFSQNNGIKSFELPAQNSLKFNKFLINPTFSFVKEEDPYLSIFNKRQWAGFENAPLTYSANYSTKFEDNNAFSIGVFLQDYSIISSQGAILNYARNVQFDDDSNLTFGINLSAFKSGINTSKIITNFPDPLLNGFKSSTIVALNPGINYGTDIIDFGISAKNLFQYDFSLSQNVTLDPLKSFQGHFMYTGYIESGDIFDGSKFITLVRAEKQRENTVLSGNLLLDIPKLGWVQGGYNNIDGIAAGLGFNITRNISFGYNFEKGLGDAAKLGFTHEFLLAYYFKESEESSDGGPIYVTKPIVVTPVVKIDNEKIAAEEKARADAEAKFLADKQKATEAKLKAIADAKAKAEEDAIAFAEKQKLNAIANAEKAKAAVDAKILSDKQKIADAKAKAISDAAKAKIDAIAQAKEDAEAAKIKAIEDANLLAQKRKSDADAAKLKGAEAAKLLADAKAKALKEKASTDAAKALELAASNKAKADAAKLLADEQKATADAAKAEAAANAKILADKQKAEADAAKLKGAEAAKLLADAKAKALKEKAATDAAKALELAASNKAKADAAKLLADEQKATADAAKAEAVANAKILADKQKAEADAAKLKAAEAAKLLAEAKVKADKEKADELAAKNKAIADATKAKEEASAKLISDAAKAKADAASKLAAAATAKADKEKADADAAKSKAQADAAKAKAEQDAKNIADANKSETDKSLDYVKKILDDATKNSKGLLSKLESTVLNKEKDLKDLKEENDLGDKGIIKTPKPFQSASEANKALETLKNELTESTKQQAGFITQYEDLLTERQKKIPNRADPVNVSYLEAIDKLKAEQLKTEQLKSNLITKLDKIKTDIDIEKKRRIKRAAFESGQSRYDKDRTALKIIKETTVQSKTALTSDDFDFGTDDQGNMQILKKIENTQPGFYLILAVHTDTTKRDAFLTKMVSSGVINVDFFFDIVSGKYFIYSKKYENIDEASLAMDSKGKKPYDAKMFIVKLEN